MPTRPPRVCQNCRQTYTTRVCERCKSLKQKRQDQARGTSHQRGYTAQWRKAAKAYLSRHPLCVHCQAKNKTTPATVVDHIKPHKGDPLLFWDERNWQALCKPCHDHKTATQDGAFQ